MRLTYDSRADAAMLTFAWGSVSETVPIDPFHGPGQIQLDFDAASHLLSIEVLWASRVLLRETIRAATSGWRRILGHRISPEWTEGRAWAAYRLSDETPSRSYVDSSDTLARDVEFGLNDGGRIVILKIRRFRLREPEVGNPPGGVAG